MDSEHIVYVKRRIAKHKYEYHPVRCLNPEMYSTIMEREFGYHELRKYLGKNANAKLWKWNNKRKDFISLRQLRVFTTEESQRLANKIIRENQYYKIQQLLKMDL